MRTKTLESWLMGIRLSHIGHRRAASHYTRRHKLFGIPVVILASLAGGTAFSSLGKFAELALVSGVLSIFAAILSSLQTFLGYSSDAERHRAAACKYGMLRRELEQFLDDTDQSPEIFREFTRNFRARWDSVDQESPPLGESIHKAAREQLQRSLDEEKRGFARAFDEQGADDAQAPAAYAAQ